MRHFATESGKSKGQFYTPAEVSRIIAKVVGIERVDKTGPDHLRSDLRFGVLVAESRVTRRRTASPSTVRKRTIATRALARMNMVLHDSPNCGDLEGQHPLKPALQKPRWRTSCKTFDFVVANPPFSDKAWSNGVDTVNDEFGRFAYGVPPAKNGDYAYLLHVIASMKTNGKGAVILAARRLVSWQCRSGIRKVIIAKGYIKAIIGLPANLFYGTGIPACIVVLDKENAHARTGIFMVDASKGFVKDGNKNRLRAQDIHKIVDAFTRQLTLPRYSRMVPLAEIEKHDFNLNIPRYIDSSEPEDLQDIEAHLKGGIPLRDLDALDDYWAVLPSVRGELFGPGDWPGYATPKVEPASVKPTILGHPEFGKFSKRIDEIFAGWRSAHTERLKSIAVGDKPKRLIEEIAEDLLARFADVPLIDKYDIYQHLMTYWAEVMQDDVYIIAQEGWAAARQIRELVRNAEGKFVETPDIIIGRQKLKAELIPPALIVARFFAKEQVELEALEAKAEEISRAIEEMDEEQGGEDGPLFEAKTEKGQLTAKSIKDRLKDIKGDKSAEEERVALKAGLKLLEQEKKALDAVKEAKTALDTKTVTHYTKLTDAEIKQLVVEDKWYATLQADVAGELDRVSQALTGRVKLLTERYAAPLPQLAQSVENLQAKVDAHLKRMGFAWN